jgi:RimJ/RimL family protein N-acetyltransferase/predicted GNAT family acetyltransferase
MPNPVTPSEEPNQIEVVDNPINHQYEAVRGGQVVGLLTYRWTSGQHVELDHTFVHPRERGHNVAGRLVERALAAVTSREATLAPNCSYVSQYIAKHPEFSKLVAPSTADRQHKQHQATSETAVGEAVAHERHAVRLEPLRIVTDRVVLRPWELVDAEVAYELFTHPSVTRWMRPVVPPIQTRLEARGLLDQWIQDSYQAPPPQGRWAIEQQDTGQVIGSIFLTTPAGAPSPLTLWWQVRPEATGEGYATEAAHAVAHHAFSVGAEQIYALVDPANERGKSIARRIGMRSYGSTRAYYNSTLNRYRLDRDELEQTQERRSLSLTD